MRRHRKVYTHRFDTRKRFQRKSDTRTQKRCQRKTNTASMARFRAWWDGVVALERRVGASASKHLQMGRFEFGMVLEAVFVLR